MIRVNSQDGATIVDAWAGVASVASRYESFARLTLPPGPVLHHPSPS